jgi:PAS domain-containing protein
LQIARQVSATIGNDFFCAMAKHLAQALAADCVFVGEFVGGQVERVKRLAVFAGAEPDDFEFELAGSAAAEIALGKAILCRTDARRRFPSDKALKRLRADAFAGVPLIASEGAAPAGLLMAVYRKTVPNLSVAKSILEIFAPRAAAELERKQEHERLSESEQRYRAFVALNCDGMWRIEFEQPVPIEGTEEEQLEQIYRYGYLAECNDALARQFGFEKAGQLTGWRLNELAPLSNPTVREANLYAIRSRHAFTTAPHIAQPVGHRRKRHAAPRLGNRPRHHQSQKHRAGARCLRTADGGSAGVVEPAGGDAARRWDHRLLQ